MPRTEKAEVMPFVRAAKPKQLQRGGFGFWKEEIGPDWRGLAQKGGARRGKAGTGRDGPGFAGQGQAMSWTNQPIANWKQLAFGW